MYELSDNVRQNLLFALPKVITRHGMYEHFRQTGDSPRDISAPGADMLIKCPIYHDNGEKQDIIFNNYLCSCGRLFIFEVSMKQGICPCNSCRYWKGLCTF